MVHSKNLGKKGKTTIVLNGILLLVFLTSSIYIMLPDNVKIVVENTKSKLYVWEDKWVLGATEYLYLYDGTKKMRAFTRQVNHTTEGNITKIIRTSKFKQNITLRQTYTFDSTVVDIALIPIEEKAECYNCQGKIVHYEYRDLTYDGETREGYNPEIFGHQTKVKWQEGFDWVKVYQNKYASDKLVIRYRPLENYEIYFVRMYDPILNASSFGQNLERCKNVIKKTIKAEVCIENSTVLHTCTPENVTCTEWEEVFYYNSTCKKETYQNVLECENDGRVRTDEKMYIYQKSNCQAHPRFNEIHCELCIDTHGGSGSGDCNGYCSSGEQDCQRINNQHEVTQESWHKIE